MCLRIALVLSCAFVVRPPSVEAHEAQNALPVACTSMALIARNNSSVPVTVTNNGFLVVANLPPKASKSFKGCPETVRAYSAKGRTVALSITKAGNRITIK